MVYAITSIWNLAFLPENQVKRIARCRVEPSSQVLIKAIPELLVKLEEQRWVVAKAIRSAASGALFVLGLRGQESQPQGVCASKLFLLCFLLCLLSSVILKRFLEKPQHGPHVMLSYCWAEQVWQTLTTHKYWVIGIGEEGENIANWGWISGVTQQSAVNK